MCAHGRACVQVVCISRCVHVCMHMCACGQMRGLAHVARAASGLNNRTGGGGLHPGEHALQMHTHIDPALLSPRPSPPAPANHTHGGAQRGAPVVEHLLPEGLAVSHIEVRAQEGCNQPPKQPRKPRAQQPGVGCMLAGRSALPHACSPHAQPHRCICLA